MTGWFCTFFFGFWGAIHIIRRVRRTVGFATDGVGVARATPHPPPQLVPTLHPALKSSAVFSHPKGEHPHGARTASDVLVAGNRCCRGRPRVFFNATAGVRTESESFF